MSKYDPYACGPQCGCDKCDPCDEPKPLEVIITAGPPINEPDPCRELPIAYDATNGCFYLWDDNTGWFEATGIEFEVIDSDPDGTGDTLVLVKCGEETRFFNSRNTALELVHRPAQDNDNDGAEILILRQTHGPNFEVDLSDLDSYVTGAVLNENNHVLTIQQNQGKPNQQVNLTYLKQTETDNTIDGDGTADDPLTVNWNRLCPDTETVDEVPENGNVLFCEGGVVKKGPVPPVDLTACIEGNIPNIGELCGEPEYLVLINDGNGCSRIGRYSPAGAARATGLFRDAQPTLPVDQNFVIPEAFPNSGNVYVFEDLRDDIDNGTVNEAVLVNSLLTATSFELDCPTRLVATTTVNINQPADVAVAFSQRMRVGYRYRVSGGAWIYPLQAGRFSTQQPLNSLESFQTIEHNPAGAIFPAGTIEFQTFYLQSGAAAPVNINANTFAAGDPTTGVPSPRTTFTPAL